MASIERRDGPKKYLKALQYSLMDFMTHTSIHGAKYVCQDDRLLIERLLWSALLCCGLGLGTFMTLNIYYRYTNTPTVSIIEHSHYPTWRLPFPAITICNNNRILQTKAEALAAELKIPAHLNRTTLLDDIRILGELSSPELPPDEGVLAVLQDILNFNDITTEQVMFELGQPCHEMLERCSWQNEIVKCSELFEPRKSHHGYCCSFNYIGVRDSPKSENWEPSRMGPIHTRLYGQRMGLTVLVNPAVDDYFVASFISAGVSVQIHDHETYPDESVIMKMVPVTKEVLVPIRLFSRVCSDDVRNLAPLVRECNFENENHLGIFEKYKHDNCLTECKMNYSLRLCSCIPYYFPNAGKYRVCDLMDAVCLHKHFNKLRTFKPGTQSEIVALVEEHGEQLKNIIKIEDAMSCNCPSQCEAISYQARVSWGDFTASEHTVNQLFGPDTNDTNRILIHIFVESNFSQVTKRDISTTASSLLGLLGGVCCIFLGCSFVSIVEFLYFTLIRLPGYLDQKKPDGESCPASPHIIRQERFPSVRTNNARFIEVIPWTTNHK